MAKNQSSWLKGLLIKEDEPAKNENQTVNTSQFTGFNIAQPQVSPAIQQQVQSDIDTPDQAYLDHLYKFMEDQNIPGPDYFEFANTLHEMAQMAGSIPEPSLFQLAYVGLKAQGVTPDVLVQTASNYIALFEKHKKEFESYLSQDGSATITAKTQENKQLEQNNVNAESQMIELQKQINSLQQLMVTNAQQIAENNTYIQNENQKIVIKNAKFQKAYQIVVDKVNGDIQKIKNYVK